MYVEDSDSRPVELNYSLSCSQADFAPTSVQDFFCNVFFNCFFKFRFFKKIGNNIGAHSERYKNITADIFEIQYFVVGKIVFP